MTSGTLHVDLHLQTGEEGASARFYLGFLGASNERTARALLPTRSEEEQLLTFKASGSTRVAAVLRFTTREKKKKRRKRAGVEYTRA